MPLLHKAQKRHAAWHKLSNTWSTLLRPWIKTDLVISAITKKNAASLYNGLEDAISNRDEDVDLNELGKRYILPSSYIGGPRHMQQRYQDAMAIARYFRKVWQ
jgi:hypothetical protein